MSGFRLDQRQLNTFRSTPLTYIFRIGYSSRNLHLYSQAFFYAQVLFSLTSVLGRGGP